MHFLSMLEDFADLALEIIRKIPGVALERNENMETGLHILARKPSAFKIQSRTYLNQLMDSRKFAKSLFIYLYTYFLRCYMIL